MVLSWLIVELIKQQPMPFSITSLFPISPADAATEKLTSILLSLRELTEQLALDHSVSRTLPSTSQSLPERPKAQDQTEIDRLQEVIRNLKSELGA